MVRRTFPLMLLYSVVFGQTPAAIRNTTIEGTVVDLQTNRPLERALITVHIDGGVSGRDPKALSDSQGRFVIQNVGPGGDRYFYSIEKEGYVYAPYPGAFKDKEQLQPPEGGDQKFSGLILRLTKMAVLSGTVLDDTGHPANKATVCALRGSADQPPALCETRTNEEGEFHLEVAPGRYYLLAGPDLFPPDRGWPGPARGSLHGPGFPQSITLRPPDAPSPPQTSALVPSFYPESIDPATAAPIVVLPNETRSAIAIRLIRMALFSVECSLTGSLYPIGDVRVFRVPQLSPIVPILELQEGSPSLSIRGLIPGVYDLQATVWEHKMANDTSPLPLSHSGSRVVKVVDRDLSGIVIQLPSPTVSLSGTAHFPRYSSSVFAIGEQCVQAKPDGTWTANISRLGTTAFGPCMPGSGFVTSVRLKGETLPSSTLNVSGPVDGLEVFLDWGSSKIKVHVGDEAGQPASDFPAIFVIPEGEVDHPKRWFSSFGWFNWVGRTASSEDTLRVPPGRYSVYAFSGLPWYEPDAVTIELLKANVSSAQAVEIDAESEKEIIVKSLRPEAGGLQRSPRFR